MRMKYSNEVCETGMQIKYADKVCAESMQYSTEWYK